MTILNATKKKKVIFHKLHSTLKFHVTRSYSKINETLSIQEMHVAVQVRATA